MADQVPVYIKESAEILASYGRGGDTLLAHLTHEHGSALKAIGGSGTINPVTGLREYVIGPLGMAAVGSGIMNNMNKREGAKWQAELARRKEISDREQAEAAAITNKQAQENALRIKQNTSARDLAPQQLFEEANMMLARDRGRFAGAPRPQYRGETVAPMSSMTQRAQTLSNQYANKPQPYQQKIDTVLQRPNTGLDINRLLNPQLADQKQFAQTNMMDTMRAQMGYATPQMNPFMQNFGRIQGEQADVSRGNLGQLSNIAGELEGKRNLGIAEGFKGLQGNVQNRRQAQIAGLTQMGQQKHAHGNMMLGGQKAQFEEEANAPYAKMDKLGRFLNQNAGNFTEDVHPDLQKPFARELTQGLHTYGIDTSKPIKDWDSTRREDNSVFKGQRTAPLPPEMVASHKMVEGITPRMETPAADQRRQLVQQLMSPESLSEKAMQNIPEHIRPQIVNLRRTAQRTFGNNIGQITNRYVQANQPFSLQHTNEVQSRAEEVARRLAEEEAEVLKQGTASQLSTQHEKGIGDLKRLNELGEHEQNDFRNTMGVVTNLNKQGAEKWSNDQNDLEDIFQNHQASSPWGFSPQMKNEIMSHGMQRGRDEAIGQMSNPAHVASLQLGHPALEAMGNRYSTVRKEAVENQERIASQQQAEQQRAAQMHAAQQQALQAQQYAQQQAQQTAQTPRAGSSDYENALNLAMDRSVDELRGYANTLPGYVAPDRNGWPAHLPALSGPGYLQGDLDRAIADLRRGNLGGGGHFSPNPEVGQTWEAGISRIPEYVRQKADRAKEHMRRNNESWMAGTKREVEFIRDQLRRDPRSIHGSTWNQKEALDRAARFGY